MRTAGRQIQIPLLNPRSEATTLGKPGSKAVGGRSTSTGHPDPFILLGVLLHLLVSRTLFYHPGRCRKSALARNGGAPPSLRHSLASCFTSWCHEPFFIAESVHVVVVRAASW